MHRTPVNSDLCSEVCDVDELACCQESYCSRRGRIGFILGIALHFVENSFLSLPRAKQEAIGRTHPYTVKGIVVYLMNDEITQVTAVKYSFFGCFVAIVAVFLVNRGRKK